MIREPLRIGGSDTLLTPIPVRIIDVRLNNVLTDRGNVYTAEKLQLDRQH
jgi:hypothetical protein